MFRRVRDKGSKTTTKSFRILLGPPRPQHTCGFVTARQHDVVPARLRALAVPAMALPAERSALEAVPSGHLGSFAPRGAELTLVAVIDTAAIHLQKGS